jgi:hypothetical protein
VILHDAAAALKRIRPAQSQAGWHRVEHLAGFFQRLGGYETFLVQGTVQGREIPALLFQAMSQSLLPLMIERQFSQILLDLRRV